MKQTKLREPILYTSLWVVSVAIIVIIDSNAPINLQGVNDILGIAIVFSVIIVGMYVLFGALIAAAKRTDRHETRDMEKYIIGKIKDIDDEIEKLKEEKKELFINNKAKWIR